MGQSMSTNVTSPRGMTSQGTLRQSLKRVYSQELEEAKLTNSRSLPGSPTGGRRRPVGGESPEMQLSLESMMKNFEKFAQHQWPTWAKRRGWIAEFPAEATSTAGGAAAAAGDSSDDGARVVQLDKDKWAFQRKRKNYANSSSDTPTPSPTNDAPAQSQSGMKREEAEGEEEEEEIGKMVDILHVEESRTGQRSRRSSGYASASNSPSMLAKKAVAVIDDDLEKYRTSLYEVTLRWMFDAEPQSWGPEKEVGEKEDLVKENPAVAAAEAEAAAAVEAVPATIQQNRPVRIYLHLFQRQWMNKSPSFIDFCPVPSEGCAATQRQLYALLFQNGNAAPHNSFPRETTCHELIQVIIACHAFLLEYEANKLALYEKCWRPGKTSRARLRRLNDTECPLILANQWLEETDQVSSDCARTLVLQESQNGDIPCNNADDLGIKT